MKTLMSLLKFKSKSTMLDLAPKWLPNAHQEFKKEEIKLYKLKESSRLKMKVRILEYTQVSI